jgi:nucleoside 2-deoxyribosyltransferase
MPYNPKDPIEACTVCGGQANIYNREHGIGEMVDCARCGDFQVSYDVAIAFNLPFRNPKEQALASYVVRKMQKPQTRPRLTTEFFEALRFQTLPTPAEASDNLIVWLAQQADGRPGTATEIAYANPTLLGMVGVVGPEDIRWIVENLRSEQMLVGRVDPELDRVGRGAARDHLPGSQLTARGWQHFEELKRAHISSRYAFLARQFNNPDLDHVFEKCLYPSVEQTGYELRTVTQRAGLIDAVIEDEIRRCRFLIADLSDDNAGAYWEAGFAEGLGKPVIYLCRANAKDGTPKKTHFDADHRHTVRWDLASLDQTATNLKAVIRNTLLGDAKQTD